MRFICPITVEFNHCDPAGIVFYPRYFEMVNATVERFFAALGWSFGKMHLDMGCGVPLVKIAAEFPAPSRLSDDLRFSLALRRIGRASADAMIEAVCGREVRMVVSLTMVWIGPGLKARAWPKELRALMLLYLEADDGA